jgi:NAD-dependent deacetylase
LYNDKNEEYRVSPETMLSRTYFFENTEKFYKFYRSKILHEKAVPNDAHKIIAELEKKGKIKAVITQNIDGLHQAAGSKNVIELHGSVKDNFCLTCRKKFGLEYIIKSSGVPLCDICGGVIKPDVVLYEEQLNRNSVDFAITHILSADMLIVGGTSLAVYPAANYAGLFFSENKNKNKKSAIINKSETNYDKMFDVSISEGIGNVFNKIYFKLYGEE